jgi:hypothetical protein
MEKELFLEEQKVLKGRDHPRNDFRVVVDFSLILVEN